jgi:hypothetical protein
MSQVGYKGKTEVDAGSFYAPYIPLLKFPETKLKIISGPIKLSEGQTAYELSKFPNDTEMAEIRNWAISAEVDKYVLAEPYYESAMMGDIDHPAIQLAKGTPKRVHTLTMLRWA